jgi:hypothetical protein
MEVFFNELSVTVASNDEEAMQWLKKLAELGKLLKNVNESSSDDSFRIRTRDDFSQQKITASQTVSDFMQTAFDFSDPIYSFLLGVFDTPYVTENDPQKTAYDLTSVSIDNKDYEVTGIAAAYLKKSLVISLDNDTKWNKCQLNIVINKLNEKADLILEKQLVKHASTKQQVIDCHLPFLANEYRLSCKPKFVPETREQNILSLVHIYTLYLGEDNNVWSIFYEKISKLDVTQKVSEIMLMVKRIAEVQGWSKATGSLEKSNKDRTIYTVPDSDFVISVDTQHGEFEIHKNKKGNNHLGAISFDGKKFKGRIEDRCLIL